MTLIETKVMWAAVYGNNAFGKGLRREPVFDAAFGYLLGPSVEDNQKLIQAWLKGWDGANDASQRVKARGATEIRRRAG